MLRVVAFAALFVAGPAAAVTITSAPGAPDPGFAPGQTLLVSFDAAPVAGVTNLASGLVRTAAGSTSGLRAAPAGTGNGVYQSIGINGSSLFDFSGWVRGRALSSLSFYWGSIDAYNHVDFLNVDGVRVGGVSGGNLPLANGNQIESITNRRVFFNFQPQERVTAMRLRSTGTAFEFDSIAAAPGAVPEPETWTLLIIGFGLVGVAVRRRSGRGVAA